MGIKIIATTRHRNTWLFILAVLTPALARAGYAESSLAEFSGKQIINVRQEGATGDGLTDDQAALSGALAKAASHPDRVVYVPGGIYRHSAVLVVDGTTLVGDGESSILKATQPLQSAVNLRGERPRISALKLSCDVGSVSRSAKGTSAMVFIQDAKHFIVDHLTIDSGVSAGILNSGGQGTADELSQIHDNRVYHTLADGIHNTQQAKYVLITNNLVYESGDDLIAVVSYEKDNGRCSDIDISSNTVRGNYHGRGITVVGGDRVRIWHNKISDTDVAGLYLASEESYHTFGDDSVTAEDNIIENACKPPCQSGHPGIFAQGRPSFPITHLLLRHNVIRHSTKDAVFLGHDVQSAQLIKNRVEGSGKFGIEGGGATDTVAEDNDITGTAKEPVSLHR